ncbi:MAG TPA: alpha/beta fold hydrolase [Longimicrobium sp.]
MTLEQQLEAFRAAHPPVRLRAARHEWTYVRGGGAGPVVLLLSGALGRAEFGFGVVAGLEDAARVLAPDYPPAGSLDELADGLAALLDAESAARAHVVGGSFGGVIAQAFAWRHPGRVASLTLSHTGAPERGAGRGAAVRLLGLLPAGLLRAMLRRRLRGTLASADPFWARQFDAMIDTLSKADVISRVRLAAEFGARYGGVPGPGRPPFPVLTIESDDDPLFPPARRAALHALYPDAQTHVFTGTGHAAGILQPAEYAAILRRFIEQAERGRSLSS